MLREFHFHSFGYVNMFVEIRGNNAIRHKQTNQTKTSSTVNAC